MSNVHDMNFMRDESIIMLVENLSIRGSLFTL